MNIAAIPAELRERAQWVMWRNEQRNGKPTKVPYQPADPNRQAKSNDPETWATFEQAMATLERFRRFAGIGYVFAAGDPFTGVDLDDCVDTQTGELHSAAAEILADLGGYRELSPSELGWHVIVEAVLHSESHKTEETPWGGAFEIYDRWRFFTLTGNGEGTPEAKQEQVDALVVRMFGKQSRNGAGPEDGAGAARTVGELLRLFPQLAKIAKHEGKAPKDPSASGWDHYLACESVRCGLSDVEIAALIRHSRVGDRKGVRGDYIARTIAKARAEVKNASAHSSRRKQEKSSAAGSASSFSPVISFPSCLGEDAYCGEAGRIVREILPYTEADPAALLISVLTMFGNAVGRGPHFRAGDCEHATNLFAAIVGETDTGRKGTAAQSPRQLVELADPTWRECVVSGLASGEGVIHHVRDPRSERRKPKKGETADPDGMVGELVDAGVKDKRLMVVESEFAKVLAVNSRKDSTLSMVLRDAWDRGTLRTLSKNSPERATGVLVSVLAQTTPMELHARLDGTEIANGFMNRFVIVAARRSKLLSRGGNVPPSVQARLSVPLREALARAQGVTEVEMSEEAWALWDEGYEPLIARPAGLVGVLTARAAPMVRRFALLYALLDSRTVVEVEHLKAALALWRYVEESTRWVFGDRFGDWVADDCLVYLREAGETGLTRNDLREQLGHNIGATRITNALRLLASAGLARSSRESTGGRPAERWFANDNGREAGEV